MYGKTSTLAATGAATLTIGGISFTYPWIAFIAAAVIVAGGITIRLVGKARQR
jgi:hypothetical protein